MYQQPGYPNPYPPRRSAIPKVIGILMIIFGSIGILGSLVNFAGGFGQAELMRQVPDWGKLKTLTTVTSVLGLVMALFQLYVGIRCVGYKPNAPSLARIYGIVGLVNVVVGLVIAFAIVNPILEKAPAFRALGGGGFTSLIAVLGSMFSAAWVIVILALMGKQSAKDACVPPPGPAPLPQARVL